MELVPDVQDYLAKSLQNSEESGNTKLTAVLHSLAIPPLYTTLRANTLKGDIEQIKKDLLASLTQQYTSRGWSPPELWSHPDIPELFVVPSLKNQVEPMTSEVIVDVPCGMAVLRGADVFAQGILSAPPYMAVGDQVSVYADLDGGCRRGLTKAYNGRKVFVGNGVARVSREQVFCGNEKLSGVGIQMTRPLYQAPCLDQVPPELAFAQNLPSVVCSRVLGPLPGDTVLDMCAAPGGKTTHLAMLMQNKGRIVALDKSKNKIPKIVENCKRCGVQIVEAYHYDGTRSLDLKQGPEGPPPYPPATFDRILLDAPCSALGQRPALRNKSKLAEVSSYPPLQKKLFSQAVSLLRPSGHLVYSTCTVPVEENEGLVAWALGHHPDIRLVKQEPHLGGPGWPCLGLTDEQRLLLQRFDPSAEKTTSQGDAPRMEAEKINFDVESSSDRRTLLWSDVNMDTIGFFIAKFVKEEKASR